MAVENSGTISEKIKNFRNQVFGVKNEKSATEQQVDAAINAEGKEVFKFTGEIKEGISVTMLAGFAEGLHILNSGSVAVVEAGVLKSYAEAGTDKAEVLTLRNEIDEKDKTITECMNLLSESETEITRLNGLITSNAQPKNSTDVKPYANTDTEVKMTAEQMTAKVKEEMKKGGHDRNY